MMQTIIQLLSGALGSIGFGLLPGLDAQKHIMCLRIGLVCVVHIISTH